MDSYSSRGFSPSGGGMFGGRAVSAILIACVAVYGVQMVSQLFFPSLGEALIVWFGSSSRFYKGLIWQPFTYMFLHGGIWHIFFNMFILAQFGQLLEATWGTKRFAIFYFVCGVSAGIATTFTPWPTIGASGAIFGLLVAFAMMWPKQIMLLFFVIPMEARYACMIFFGLEVYFLVSGTGGNVSNLAHVVGGVAGWVMLRYEREIGQKVERFQEKREKFDIQRHEEENRRVDQLLDKINESGIHSLSEAEKRFLKNIRNRRAGRR